MDDIGTYAIECYNLSKHYGRGKGKLQVLQNLEMKVPKGKIYGLLGPSGCGKTTLLRCCLGQLSKDSGLVLTLGRPPLTRGHGIPGSRVGYMPQDLALYGEFTIKEMLIYFATLHKMSRKDANARIDFLLDLLNLPFRNRMVAYLSGGQKRRVSFAVALIQSPELLILDEPTVGVDPLLRQKIWEYLLQFAQTGQTTIILTTHYIEEARNADVVGLMRNGKLLAEEDPQVLISTYNFPTLEEVFLKLCMADIEGDDDEHDIPSSVRAASISEVNERTRLLSNGQVTQYTNQVYEDTPAVVELPNGKSNQHGSGDDDVFVDEEAVKPRPKVGVVRSLSVMTTKSETPEYHYDKPPLKYTDIFPSLLNMWALLVKDLLKLVRNPGLTLFQFILPVVEVCLFYLAIGGKPQNLDVAVINNDPDGPFNLSQKFLAQIDDSMINQKPVDSLDEAISDLRNGKYWGVIDIPENYSYYLIQRQVEGISADNATLWGSTVRVTLDATNQQIAISIQTGLLAAYESFIEVVLTSLALNPALGQIPLVFLDPVYGELDGPFTYFMAAGVIITIIFFHAVALTSMTFVVERKEGLLDRIWVSGVGSGEVSIAHVMTQFLIISVQIALVLVFTFAVFELPNEGSLFLVILMMMLQGLCGMALGLLISAFCDSESTAIQLALGSFYPLLLLSGVVWPIQAMPEPLYYIALVLPQTLSAEGIRAILGRGWDMSYFEVWIGFVATTAWWLVLLTLATIVLRVRR
ncbi:ABC transporter G family member 20-like [Lytechinus pictus]|uniref:ABC transporter G family member 20-like n=1 Tax=Lytechinus pictus TaxID=7653 RepID=UPI0030B9B925